MSWYRGCLRIHVHVCYLLTQQEQYMSNKAVPSVENATKVLSVAIYSRYTGNYDRS